ncbi:MAG: thiamine phosphate synthase [Methylococcales bacterium]
MNKQFPASGLYIITDHSLPDQQIINTTQAALSAGANVVQLRHKISDAVQSEFQSRTLALAQVLLTLCHHYQVPLIINDDPQLAVQAGADGVHLGKDDTDITSARQQLGDQAIIGVSCYNSLELALQAQAKGANYIAFGRFFSSASKPDATPADIQLLSQARYQINIPIIAIGGITPENAGLLLDAGADYLAVIQGIYGQPDPSLAARNYLNVLDSSLQNPDT